MLRFHKVKFLKYCGVGAFAAIIKFSLFVMLYNSGINYTFAASLAYLVSAIFHFTVNFHYTFESKSGKLNVKIYRYFALSCLNYLTTIVVINFFVSFLNVNVYLSMLFAISINIGSNYLISKYWVFNPASPVRQIN